MYAVADGQSRFTSRDAIHSLESSVAVFVLEGHAHRMESLSHAISITENGKQLLARLDGPIMGLHRRQLSHLSKGELAELNRLLVRARDSVS